MPGRPFARVLSTCLAAVFAAGFPFVPQATADDVPRVLVAPFRVIDGSVPAALGPKFSDILSDELHGQDGLLLVAPKPVAAAPAATPDAAKAALGRINRGLSMIRRLKLRPGAAEVEAGLEDYASFPAYEDAKKVHEAYLQLAVAYSRLGANDSAQAALQSALRISPAARLSGNYPPVFRTAFNEAKRRVNAGDKGTVSFSGAGQVELDGRTVGASPAQVSGVPAGDHFVRVVRPDGSIWGLKLAVTDGTNGVAIPAGESSSPAVASVPELAPLEKNRIDPGVLQGLGGLAKSAGVDFIVFGAVYKSGDGVGVAAHLYSARTHHSTALQTLHVDADLISAGIEGNKLADQVNQLTRAFPRPGEAVPGLVASELKVQPTVAAIEPPPAKPQPTSTQPIVVKAPEDQPKIVLVTPARQVEPNPVENPEPQGGLTEPNPEPAVTEIPSDQKSHAWVWIVAGAAVVAGGAVGGYFLYKNASTPTTGTAQLNFQ